MTVSPDLPGYVDLSMYDADERDLVDRALADAAVKMPEWVPREGNTEVVLIESMALMVAELVYAINRLPETVMAGLLGLYGLDRDAGASTTGKVTFTLADALGHLIPAGTRVRATVAVTGETVDLLTDEPLEVLAAETAGTVGVTAVERGEAANGLPAGHRLDLIDAVPYVERVEVAAGGLAGGRDPETDAAYFDRGSALLSRLVSTLVLADHFTAAALEQAGVGRARTVDLYDPAAGTGGPGDHAGHVTVAVADLDGAPLSTSAKADVEAVLESRAVAGLNVHVVDPTTTTVPVTVTVTSTSVDDAAVIADVQAAVADYLDPATWPWSGTVWRNELIALVDRVAGVGRVVTLAEPAADVVLAGVAPLAQAGAVTVTVDGGA